MQLRKYLKGYKDAPYIVEGFEQGFSLRLRDNTTLQPYTKILPVKPDVKSKLMDEVHRGRILGPFHTPPVPDLMISPICVIPKSDGKFRMIFNLSHPKEHSVNDNIPEHHTSVTYCTVADVAQWITHNPGP